MGFKAKVPSGDRKVGCDCELFASPGPQQRAIVADSQPHFSARTGGGPEADLPNEGQLAGSLIFWRLVRNPWHT
jgi:hypothetical protein